MTSQTTKPLVLRRLLWFGKDMPIDISDPCPPFDLAVTPEGQLSNTQLLGAPFVLFLYPRDNTSTCTAEALGFAAVAEEFAAAGCKVIGCSADSIASHIKFQTKHGFSLPLLSDPDLQLIAPLGCWVEKQMYGRSYMGISRSTFLFGADGRLLMSWRDIRLKGHIEAVLKAACAL